MFVPMRNYGKFGFVSDTPASMLPIGAWSMVRNVRFTGNYIERRLEPDMLDEVDGGAPLVNPRAYPGGVMWGQQFYDGTIVRLVVATATELWMINSDATQWVNVTRASGNYTTPADGFWTSFAWGNTVVFNNGTDIPQVYHPGQAKFIDIPRWGLITADDGTPDYDTQARARILVPYKSFIVACNFTETLQSGFLEQQNTVWWSDGFQTPNLYDDLGYNPWDYNASTNLSGKNPIGLEDGPIQWAATLGEGLMIYNSSSTTQMLFSGGGFVMDFRRLFDYGCVGIYGAAEFLNYHYVVGPDVQFVHDGNTVKQVAEDRVRDWFYRNVRNLESTVRVSTDYTNREVIVQFDVTPDENISNASDPHRLGLVYNYDDDNYSVIDAAVDRGAGLDSVNCMVYGLDIGRVSEVGQDWDASTLSWDSNGALRWDQLQGGAASQSVRVSMFWITPNGLYRANQLSTASPNKQYYVRKTNMDLDELNPALTTNLWKHLRQVYPHIIGKGMMRARFGWSPNLEIYPTWGPWSDFRLLDEDLPLTQQSDVKIDCRTTGRYLAVEYNFNDIKAMKFSGADMDVMPVYGR